MDDIDAAIQRELMLQDPSRSLFNSSRSPRTPEAAQQRLHSHGIEAVAESPEPETLPGDPVPGMRQLLTVLSASHPEGLTAASFASLHRVLQAADTENTGAITAQAFALCLHRLLPSLPRTGIDGLMGQMYLTALTGGIDYTDFCAALQALASRDGLS
jgi:hypothetical protein